jgi:hypothetical protein
MTNHFENAPILSLDEQIENVEFRLGQMIQKAESGEQWAEICAIEARELVPLLKLKINERVRNLHERNRVVEPRTAAGSLD